MTEGERCQCAGRAVNTTAAMANRGGTGPADPPMVAMTRSGS